MSGAAWWMAGRSSLLDGLIGYWPLEGSSRNSMTGVLGTDVNVTYAAGHRGLGAHLNGNAWITTDCAGVGGSAPRSLSVWFRAASLQDTWVCGYGTASANAAFQVYIAPTGTVYMGAWVGLVPVGTYTAGQWTHAVVTYDGTTVHGAVNGVPATPTAIALSTGATKPLLLGGGVSAAVLTGDVDEVGFWSRALTAAEQLACYTGTPFS